MLRSSRTCRPFLEVTALRPRSRERDIPGAHPTPHVTTTTAHSSIEGTGLPREKQQTLRDPHPSSTHIDRHLLTERQQKHIVVTVTRRLTLSTKGTAVTTANPLRQAVEGLTIPRLLRRNAERFPDLPALTSGRGPDARPLTWSQLRSEVAALTRGLSLVGLQRDERVLISMSKRTEHWITDLAAVHLGALPCTLYETLSTEQIRYVAQHIAATTVVLEGEEEMRRWGPVLDELPHLRTVVVLDPSLIPADDRRFVTYSGLRGDAVDEGADPGFEELTDAL